MDDNNTSARDTGRRVPLRAWVAGVMFEDRFVYAQELTLSHPLRLIRQPENEFDPNAIQVIQPQMGQIGFLPRQMAAVFDGRMDASQTALDASVIELHQEPTPHQVRVQIEFEVPAEWLALAPAAPEDRLRVILYHAQTSSTSTHLLLNCSADQLLTVRDLLKANDVEVSRTGYSTWPAANGHQYEWYVRMPIQTDAQLAHIVQLDRTDVCGSTRR